jgi:hypothetical protein
VKNKRPYLIVSVILLSVFILGFLAGFSSHRPIKEALTKQEMVERVGPSDFLDSMKRKITQNLNLTEVQQIFVEEEIHIMTERIQEAQREFHPKMNQFQLDTIDSIMEILDEDQRAMMQLRRDSVARSPRFPMGGQGFGPPAGGRPPIGSGPPPWGGGPPTGGRPGSTEQGKNVDQQ